MALSGTIGNSSSNSSSSSSSSSSAILISFLAGVASASLLFWTFAVRRIQEEKEEFDVDTEGSSSVTRNEMNNYKNRIGEMPFRKQSAKTRWPWDTITRTVSSWAVDEEQEDDSVMEDDDDKTDATTPTTTTSPTAKSDLCIGSIFGLDVGGTLAKLVYFEQQPYATPPPTTASHRELHYHQAASAAAVLEARRASFRTSSVGSLWDIQREKKSRARSNLHTSDSEEDLKPLYRMRQESVPDNLDRYAESCNISKSTVTTPHSARNVVLGLDLQNLHGEEEEVVEEQQHNSGHEHKAPQHSEQQMRTKSEPSSSSSGTSNNGGGMRRVRSMFDLSKSRDAAEALDRFYNFARRLDTYETGVKDKHLSFYSRELGGDFHFIRFETRRMENAMDLIRVNNLHLNIHEMGATGGGAHKYASDWQDTLGIVMVKQDELDSLVAGMQFVLSTVVGECYTFRPKIRRNYKRQDATEPAARLSTVSSTSSNQSSSSSNSNGERTNNSGRDSQHDHDDDDKSRIDEWWWSRKVQRDVVMGSDIYPYLLVTIGTGVSILRVDGPRKHERISGSTIGGGTYWGLIRLLTDVDDFESVMKLAERGDPSKVDMMVGDIYGQDSAALEKIGLPSNLVASSFGKLVAKNDPASGIKQEDLARALLLMVTNNIGQVAYLNAQLHKTRRIYFVGNFLRHNQISQQRLSYAIDYWSKGEMEALFLEHEGYFGALGAFLLSQGISHGDQGFFQWDNPTEGGDESQPLPSFGMPQHFRRKTMSGVDKRRASDTLFGGVEQPSTHRPQRTRTASIS